MLLLIIVWFQLLSVVKTEGNVADYDLPGIFSDTFCSDDILKVKFEPICTCKQLHTVTDVYSMCREYVKFGSCIEDHIDDGTWGYLKHTFSKTRFIETMDYLCNTNKDTIEGTTQCISHDQSQRCTNLIMPKLKNLTDIDETLSCKLIDKMSECIVNVFQRNKCSPQIQYFWSKLSQASAAAKCTKYFNGSRTSACYNMIDKAHPKRKHYTMEQCLELVDMTKECFLIERQHSVHHYDIWYMKEFKLERYIKFERFRCKIQEERKKDIHCETERRKKENDKCRKNHDTAFNRHVNLIKNGTDVSVPEICKLYDRLLQCVEQAFARCPKANSYHQLAHYCGSMPASCSSCPIALEMSSASSVLTTTIISTLGVMFLQYLL